MPKQVYKFVVLTNPVEGREAEYNDWYDGVHLRDVTAIPGILRAERFELADSQRSFPQPYKYLAIYEIETDDLQWVADEIGRRAGTATMVISPAMAQEKMAALYRPR